MENLNLPPFYVGQKVVCDEKDPDALINDRYNEELINGNEYIITDTNPFPVYHLPLVMVNGSCCFWKASSFKPIQESKFRAVSFEKIMEETEKICVN